MLRSLKRGKTEKRITSMIDSGQGVIGLKQLDNLSYGNIEDLINSIRQKRQALTYLKEMNKSVFEWVRKEIDCLNTVQEQPYKGGMPNWQRYLTTNISDKLSDRQTALTLLRTICYGSDCFKCLQNILCHYGDQEWIANQEAKMCEFEQLLTEECSRYTKTHFETQSRIGYHIVKNKRAKTQ